MLRWLTNLRKQGAVTPTDAVVLAATGVTISDRRKNAMTL